MTKIDTKLAGRSLGDRAAYFIVRNLLFVFLKVWCRLRVEGRENLPAKGLFVLAPTHRSIIDTPVASGVANRRLRFLGADKWWSNRALRPAAHGARRLPGHAAARSIARR